MKRILGLILSAVLMVCLIPASFAAETGDVIVSGTLNLDAKGAILMEASTGTVLYEQDSKEKLYPASVTKVMTMLLVMEALDEGKISEDDPVTASENAVSYGGTQIYLEVGETMSLRDLLKAVAINSANDAAAALAEHVSGSEPAFVERMNARAKELGAEHTHFVNPCGLPDPDHYTCAYDVALMTRELLTHPRILDYTGIWMDSLRGGGFGLANTNKLLKTYEGMTGMKTGYTEAAGHCLSATATRGDVSLIAVILGGETSKGRFASAASLLDYGFGNYTLVRRAVGQIAPISVTKGKASSVSVAAEGEYRAVLKKGNQSDLTVEIETEPSLKAPVEVGQIVGKVRFFLNGTEVSSVPVVAVEAVEKAGFFDYLARLADCLF